MWLLAGQHVALDWRQGALKGMATPKKSVNFFELDEQQVEHEKRDKGSEFGKGIVWLNMKDWQLRHERGAKAAAAVVSLYPPVAERRDTKERLRVPRAQTARATLWAPVMCTKSVLKSL